MLSHPMHTNNRQKACARRPVICTELCSHRARITPNRHHLVQSEHTAHYDNEQKRLRALTSIDDG